MALESEQPLISFLIATMPSRRSVYLTLYEEIVRQMMAKNNEGEYIMSDEPPIGFHVDDSMEYNIGAKRNKLLLKATGKYIVFLDDDDSIAPNYISLILEACRSNDDCIGISGTILHEGVTKQWHISKDYGHWFTKDNVFYRTPNHISPVKREIALKAMFPEIPHGEDAEYSRRILPYLKTETKITENIYFYYPSH